MGGLRGKKQSGDRDKKFNGWGRDEIWISIACYLNSVHLKSTEICSLNKYFIQQVK